VGEGLVSEKEQRPVEPNQVSASITPSGWGDGVEGSTVRDDFLGIANEVRVFAKKSAAFVGAFTGSLMQSLGEEFVSGKAYRSKSGSRPSVFEQGQTLPNDEVISGDAKLEEVDTKDYFMKVSSYSSKDGSVED
jgi:hypothetical protein